jgi:2-oxoglutarate dehydrogenase E2 component (dihydrolipoamide succinyltransferase)
MLLRLVTHTAMARSVLRVAPRQQRLFGTIMTMNVPPMGDSITEGTITRWEKQAGEYVKENETFVVIETDKVSVDVGATGFAGTLVELIPKAGDTVKVGSPLAKFDTSAVAPTSASPPKPAEAVASAKAPPSAPAPVPVPAAAAPAPPKPAAAAAAPTPPKPAAAAAPTTPLGERTVTREKMTRMRLRIAERLVDAQATGALLTTFNEIDMTNLITARNMYKDVFEKKHGIKLGFMSAFVKASVAALQEIPIVNASIEGQEIVHHNFIDMSVAVSAPRGLVVPVIRNAERLSFAEIEREIAVLAQKAKDDKLTLEEMSGGTFTITNGGVFGSMMSTPMINSPQSAILGMHATKLRPVVMDNGSIVARQIMYVALTYDHRLVDGRESVTFLKSIKEKIEDPVRLLWGL